MAKKREYFDKEKNTHWVASVNPNYFCVFPMVEYAGRTAGQCFTTKNLEKNTTGGLISFKAGKRLNKAVSWFVAANTKPMVTKGGRVIDYVNIQFITLTLSGTQKHDDNWIKANMLNPFIDVIKKEHDVINYIWRAEAQANGNIHFHLVVDKFIYWKKIKSVWNRLQATHGYIDEYQSKFAGMHFMQYWDTMSKYYIGKYGKLAQHKAAEVFNEQRATGWSEPNSTDIHKAYKAKNVAGYISKYISKTSKGLVSNIKYETNRDGTTKVVQEQMNSSCQTNKCTRVIQGRQWYLSTSLQGIGNVQIEMSSDAGSCLRSLIGGIAEKIELKQLFEGQYLPDLYRCDFMPYLSNLPLLKDYFEENFKKITCTQ